MATKVFINGMGVLGRRIFRMLLDDSFGSSNFELVGINDQFPATSMQYLLEHDTVYGKLTGHTIATMGTYPNEVLEVDGRIIRYYCYGAGAKNSAGEVLDWDDLPLGELNVDVVINCTGTLSVTQLQKFIHAGARSVIGCEGNSYTASEAARFVWALNTDYYTKEQNIAVCPSGDAIASSIMLKLLNESYTVESAILEHIISYTNLNNLQDSNKSTTEPQVGRAGAWNIIPCTSKTSRSVGQIVPVINGKVSSFEHRCGTIAGSYTDIIATLAKDFSKDDFTATIKKNTVNTLTDAYTNNHPCLGYADSLSWGTSSDAIGDIYATYNMNNPTVGAGDDATFVRLGVSYDAITLQAANAILMARYHGQ